MILPEYEIVRDLFLQYEINVSRETFAKLETYAEFLVAYNQNVNLTAITDGDGILKKHFLDSFLLYTSCLDCFPDDAKVLDIGSGAGFPSVPIALIAPDLDITLLDALNKRIVFLELLREKLGCHYTAVHGRAELFIKENVSRETFDVVTSRAVANLPTLAEYSLPYVKIGGHWLAMKAHEEIEPALKAIKLLGGELQSTVSYSLPDGDERVIYVVKKISASPTKYPRNSSQIKQKPL